MEALVKAGRSTSLPMASVHCFNGEEGLEAILITTESGLSL